MPLLTPPPAAPQRGDRTTFANRVDAFITWLINFVTELVALVSNLNSIAAGGAYAIPYTFSAITSTSSNPDVGYVRLNSSTQGAATVLSMSAISQGVDLTQILSLFSASSSVTKGSIRLQKLGDTSKWLTFDVMGVVDPGGYRNVTVLNTGKSQPSPFSDGDRVMLFFQRTGDKGDKGDKGDSTVTQIMRVRDDQPAGGSGDTSVATTWAVRRLNNVIANTIVGASLSNNQITLPAGTYRYSGSANASAVGSHQAQLYNVTDSAIIDHGTTEINGTGSSVSNRSVLRGTFTLAAAKVITLRHWTSAAGSFGTYAATGITQVYAELQFEKVA